MTKRPFESAEIMKYKIIESVAHDPDGDQITTSLENAPNVQAREWLTYLYSGHTTSEKREAFILWLNSNELNQEAFKRCQRVWQTIGMADCAADWITQHATQESVSAVKTRPKHILARAAVLLSGLAASITLLVVNGVFHTTDRLEIAVPATLFTSSIGQNRMITLSDGSDVILAGNSSILVNIDQYERHITLRKGSAYFDVSHDPYRVFSVTAQHTQVRVRGTAFEVEHSPDNELKISVQRGLVDVVDLPENDNEDEKVLQLHPYEQLQANIDGTFISDVSRFDPEIEFAWLSERFIYDNAPLKSVVMDINRYTKKPIVILDKDINELPITASFTFKQIDQMLAGLAAAYPITLTEEDTRNVLTKH